MRCLLTQRSAWKTYYDHKNAASGGQNIRSKLNRRNWRAIFQNLFLLFLCPGRPSAAPVVWTPVRPAQPHDRTNTSNIYRKSLEEKLAPRREEQLISSGGTLNGLHTGPPLFHENCSPSLQENSVIQSAAGLRYPDREIPACGSGPSGYNCELGWADILQCEDNPTVCQGCKLDRRPARPALLPALRSTDLTTHILLM